MSNVLGAINPYRRLLAGAGTAIITLFFCFMTTLALLGREHYEWGIPFSLTAWLVVVVTGYLVGAALLAGLSWVLERMGRLITVNYIALGLLIALLMWLITEVPAISSGRAKIVEEWKGLALSVLVAATISFIAGRRSSNKSNTGSDQRN